MGSPGPKRGVDLVATVTPREAAHPVLWPALQDPGKGTSAGCAVGRPGRGRRVGGARSGGGALRGEARRPSPPRRPNRSRALVAAARQADCVCLGLPPVDEPEELLDTK
eukprot:3693562-Prymnesium_polylepis.2